MSLVRERTLILRENSNENKRATLRELRFWSGLSALSTALIRRERLKIQHRLLLKSATFLRRFFINFSFLFDCCLHFSIHTLYAAQHLFVSVTWLYMKSCELRRFGFIILHTEHTQKSVTEIGILIKHISYVFVWLVVVSCCCWCC